MGHPRRGGGQSGYDFTGSTTDAVLDGTDFLLGKSISAGIFARFEKVPSPGS